MNPDGSTGYYVDPATGEEWYNGVKQGSSTTTAKLQLTDFENGTYLFDTPQGSVQGRLVWRRDTATDAALSGWHIIAADGTDIPFTPGITLIAPTGTGYVFGSLGTVVDQRDLSSSQTTPVSGDLIPLTQNGQVVPGKFVNPNTGAIVDLSDPTGGTGRDEDARALDRAQIAHLAAQEQIAREQLAADERQAKLRALIDVVNNAANLKGQYARQINEIQPDFARFASGLHGMANRGDTPTIAYGNILTERANQPIPTIDLNAPSSVIDSQTQQLINYNNQPPIVAPFGAPGMASGGTMGMNGDVKFGTGKRGVIVGDAQMNGDEELVVTDPSRGIVEVIPIVGRAQSGAEIPFPYTPESTYGTLSDFYRPFGITNVGDVPTNITATPTSLGYSAPRTTTDFSTAPLPPYGSSSEQYFEGVTGKNLLLPNPSTIANELRMLRSNLGIGSPEWQAVKSFYETARDAQGRRSGFGNIDAMLDVFTIRGRPGANRAPIGIR